jgi:hypothetical protein
MPRYSLETTTITALFLWLLGSFVYPFGGGLVHLLLIVIVIAGQIWIVQARPLIQNPTVQLRVRR